MLNLVALHRSFFARGQALLGYQFCTPRVQSSDFHRYRIAMKALHRRSSWRLWVWDDEQKNPCTSQKKPWSSCAAWFRSLEPFGGPKTPRSPRNQLRLSWVTWGLLTIQELNPERFFISADLDINLPWLEFRLICPSIDVELGPCPFATATTCS